MKFCSHCGAQCKDSAMFCTTCGHKLNEASPQQNIPPQPNIPPQQEVPPQPNVPPPSNMPPYQQVPQYPMPPRPVASTARTPLLQMLESPALIVATILLSASVLLTFISVCMSNWTSVFTMTASILGLIGLWMLVGNVQSTKGRGLPLSLSSFSLFKISMIIAIVANCIYVLIMDIFLIIGMAMIGDRYSYYYDAAIMAAVVIAFVLITAYEVLAILYYVQGMRVVSDVRLALEMGQQPRPFPKYFIVASFILGIGGLLGGIVMLIFTSVGSLGYYYYGFSIAPIVLNFLAMLAGAGFYIVIGVCLSKLNQTFAYHMANQQQNRPQ